ncbi:MAG: 4-phosphoerythronate dehydrogenase [Muribaculaceae bacterium]|nr:4-phosphoerythronate dehydrogenase [Muribaculaceae bacterium]
MKPKLIIDDAIPFLDGRLESHFDCRYMPGEEISRADLRDAEGLLVRTRTRCDEELLKDTPVTFVATGTIGLDHIDTEWCDEHGIHWQNAPGCNAPAVAQYVFRALSELGLPLDLDGIPQEQRPVLGIVGKGHVGGIVAEWARRLGLNVIVSDPPRAAQGFEDEDYLSLKEVMGRADAVTFHTPLIKKSRPGLPSTLHLAGAGEFEMLKPGAIVINAARGGIVDEEALLAAKREKGLKIAIDTWEGEPEINTDTLREADIATFHIAGYSRQGKERATRAILSGLEEHFNTILPESDLAAPYTPPANLTEEVIRKSYDIMTDDYIMRQEYKEFEHLRNAYPLREEVK